MKTNKDQASPSPNQGQVGFSSHTYVPGGSLATNNPGQGPQTLMLGPLGTAAGGTLERGLAGAYSPGTWSPGLSAWFPCSVSPTLAPGPLAPQKLPAS